MEKGTINCPNCGNEFELSDVLTGQIREQLKTELQQEVLKRETALQKKLDVLKDEKDALEVQRGRLDEEVEKQLVKKVADIESKTAKKIELKFSEEREELESSLAEQNESLKAFKQQEVEFRKKQRELEQAKEDVELDVQRKLDEERKVIRKAVEAKASEEHRLKDMEQAKVINDLRKSLEDMKRKAEQGSMETQGEVLELDFEAQLRSFFPHDEIVPVPKGIRGADLIQTVKTPFGQECGVLLWETKNTKAWSGQWIPKLKDDMIETRAAIAILVSVTLPDGVARFGAVDGVWVSDPLSAIPLAVALRQQLVALDRERQASVGKNEKMELLYQYLAGTEFKQKIEGVVEAFTSMQEQINRERRAMEKQWKERGKQIERVVKNTVGLYGDMQGIIGGQIPEIPALELDDVKELTTSIASVDEE